MDRITIANKVLHQGQIAGQEAIIPARHFRCDQWIEPANGNDYRGPRVHSPHKMFVCLGVDFNQAARTEIIRLGSGMHV